MHVRVLDSLSLSLYYNQQKYKKESFIGAFKKYVQNNARIKEIRPQGEHMANVFDCFLIPEVVEWANNNVDETLSRYRLWQGINKDIYFSIKSKPTQDRDVPPGFQVNVYTKDHRFKDLVRRVIVPAVSNVLGFMPKERMKCFYWEIQPISNIDEAKLEKMISAIIDAVEKSSQKRVK